MKSILFALILSAHILNAYPVSAGAPGAINAPKNMSNCAINTPVVADIVIAEAPTYANCAAVEVVLNDVPLPTDELLCNKTYMDYRTITNKDSNQWKYIHSDAISLDDKGFLVTEDGYIGVALGSYFGPVGSKYIFELDTGIELKVVKIECKSDKHTCKNNYKAGCNDVIEFVIDTKAAYMRENVWGNGLIFQGNFNNCEDFRGNIVGIKEVIYDEILLG